jgi:hypothetical protein
VIVQESLRGRCATFDAQDAVHDELVVPHGRFLGAHVVVHVVRVEHDREDGSRVQNVAARDEVGRDVVAHDEAREELDERQVQCELDEAVLLIHLKVIR